MTNLTKLFVLAIVACLMTSCAGWTAAETTGVVLTGAGAFVGFIEAISPMLTPEQQAMLTAQAGNIQTVVDATTKAVGQIAQAISDVKAQHAAEQSGAFSDGEKTAVVTGVTALGIGVSRYLSAKKHGPKTPVVA